jgi:hypothetical protein
MTERDELRSHLSLLVQSFDESLKDGDTESSFATARDLGIEVYADTIISRAEEVGVLCAACEDLADAVGGIDYHESGWGLRAVWRQWHRVADALEPTDGVALRVRMAAAQLEDWIGSEHLDLEMLPDLVSIAAAEAELLDLAIRWRAAVDADREDEFWTVSGDRSEQLFGLLAWLKADMRDRGELSLDDQPIRLTDVHGG